MFMLRGIAVSLAFFALLYSLLSLLVLCTWRYLMLLRPGERRAEFLFWMRIAPLVASAAVTLALVVPAYVRLEPRSIDEDIAVPLALGFGCLFLLGLGLFRVVVAHKKSARIVTGWLAGADALDASVPAPLFRTHQHAPPLTLVGVCSPSIVVSDATVDRLTTDELHVAVQHEIAHMRSRDNLKKLVFHCSPFPGMGPLEAAWQDAAELAADDQAVTSVREALDLAAALIKLSRILPARLAPAFTMALVSGNSSLTLRVERLLAWEEGRACRSTVFSSYIVPLACAALLAAIASYGPALTVTHAISEWLVR